MSSAICFFLVLSIVTNVFRVLSIIDDDRLPSQDLLAAAPCGTYSASCSPRFFSCYNFCTDKGRLCISCFTFSFRVSSSITPFV